MQLYIALNSEFAYAESGGGQTSAMHVGSESFWLACALLLSIAIVCGLVGGFLSWRGGTNPFKATLYGSSACGCTLGLGLAFFALLAQ